MKNNYNGNIPCYNSCYIMGPTGPTGPQGLPSSQVDVGITTTSAPGTPANVYTSGDENHVILNFVIPRGEQGPIPVIDIGNVITGEAGTEAKVTITPITNQKEDYNG